MDKHWHYISIVFIIVLMMLCIYMFFNTTDQQKSNQQPYFTAFNGTKYGLVNNAYIEVECYDDYHCSEYGVKLGDVKVIHRQLCINFNCTDRLLGCVSAAKIDYNMSNPQCANIGNLCTCTNYVITSPKRTIEYNFSKQTYDEIGYYEEIIKFELL